MHKFGLALHLSRVLILIAAIVSVSTLMVFKVNVFVSCLF